MEADRSDLDIVTAVLARTPEWVRHDLGSKEPHVRTRAEEALALMIDAAFRGERGEGATK